MKNAFTISTGASTNVTSTTLLASWEKCIDKSVFSR